MQRQEQLKLKERTKQDNRNYALNTCYFYKWKWKTTQISHRL